MIDVCEVRPPASIAKPTTLSRPSRIASDVLGRGVEIGVVSFKPTDQAIASVAAIPGSYPSIPTKFSAVVWSPPAIGSAPFGSTICRSPSTTFTLGSTPV